MCKIAFDGKASSLLFEMCSMNKFDPDQEEVVSKSEALFPFVVYQSV